MRVAIAIAQQRPVALATSSRSAHASSSRALASKARTSPFAQPEPDSDEKLSKYEELKQRQEAIAEMMREKTMREVNKAAQSRRPEGVHHVLKETAPDLKDAVKRLVDNDGVGANYDESREEWGGPKGEEPTRYGDWEVKGRISDF